MSNNKKKSGIHTVSSALIILLASAAFVFQSCARANAEGDVVTITQGAAEQISEQAVSEPSAAPETATETSVPETATEPVSETVLLTEPPTESTEPPTEPPATPATDPPAADPIPSTADITALKPDDYVRHMLDTAIRYTGGDGETYMVEPPPLGRPDELQQKILPLRSAPAPVDYFDDAIFIGDSVTTGFEAYRKDMTFLGEKIPLNYKVFAAKSYGAYNSTVEISERSVHPLYKGEQCYPEDIIGVYGSKKVFICIGLNDAGWEGDDQFTRYYRLLLTRIKEKNPDVKIIIASITPLTKNGETTTTNSLKNPRIAELNNLLINLAYEENVYFLDYAYALRDENQVLYDAFSSDDYCHLSVPAYSRILEYILFHPVD